MVVHGWPVINRLFRIAMSRYTLLKGLKALILQPVLYIRVPRMYVTGFLICIRSIAKMPPETPDASAPTVGAVAIMAAPVAIWTVVI
jgi:hypothetical protein